MVQQSCFTLISGVSQSQAGIINMVHREYLFSFTHTEIVHLLCHFLITLISWVSLCLKYRIFFSIQYGWGLWVLHIIYLLLLIDHSTEVKQICTFTLQDTKLYMRIWQGGVRDINIMSHQKTEIICLITDIILCKDQNKNVQIKDKYILYPHSQKGGYIAITLSVRPSFRPFVRPFTLS